MNSAFRYKTVWLSLTCLLIATALAVPHIFADDKPGGCKFGCIPGKLEIATIVGDNYCPACALKKELGASSACKTFGHRHALKVISMVDACGEAKPEYIGKTLFYLENDASRKLITELNGVTVSIKGKVYMEVPMIEVTSFNLTEVR